MLASMLSDFCENLLIHVLWKCLKKVPELCCLVKPNMNKLGTTLKGIALFLLYLNIVLESGDQNTKKNLVAKQFLGFDIEYH